jgi:hypothetical protein
MAPQVLITPRSPAHTDLEVTVDTPKSSVSRAPVDPKTRLERLEERYRHELMGENERCELYGRIVKMRAKIKRGS